MLKEIAHQEPAWEIARLFPAQGNWSFDDYLDLEARSGSKLIEFSNGQIEVLSTPSIRHQSIVGVLVRLLTAYILQRDFGYVFFAPTKVKLWDNKIREPDVLFVSHQNFPLRTEQWFEKIDLAMEIISPDDPSRNLETKRREYAQAGIAEYWIVDPRSQEIMVLTLDGKRYAVHGVFATGESASSVLLEGFNVSVDEVFATL